MTEGTTQTSKHKKQDRAKINKSNKVFSIETAKNETEKNTY